MFEEQIKVSRLRYNEHQNVAERKAELEKFALSIIEECIAMFAREAEMLRKCRKSTLDFDEKNRLAEGEHAYEYAIELMQKKFGIMVAL